MSFATSAASAVRRPARVRWRIFLFLFAFTFAAYVQRTMLSVAAERMMPELGLTQVQIGWLETAFLTTYAALQFPGGVLGQAVGARIMFVVCGVVGVAATLATPLLPAISAGTVLFGGLVAAQLVLGAVQAPFFGLLSGTLERWFPSRQWALTQGLSSGGIGLGAAAAPAVIASLMVVIGWRAALVWVALPVLVLIGLWWRDGRNTPHEHPDVGPDELQELDLSAREPSTQPASLRRVLRLLLDRDLLGLSVSYLAMNFVFYMISFWSFLYLIQARHFSELQGGFGAAAPPLAGALGAMLGGFTGSALTARFGAKVGLRITPLIALPAAGLCLLLVAHTDQAMVALAGLALAFGLVEMTEGSYWAASMEIGREDAVAAGGLLNTGGNLGGIVATPLVAALSAHGNWNAPFLVGAGFALAGALIWLVIDPGKRRTA
ncbi:MFS transporter [Phenylobacterium montanum]|uniref:MFS transporter n=1 Tax=Phenylobacterium montanum TaxID=2823693 RepID=A0A975IXG2_9CAUL|nr:MFS transporter [Caulobacter sp. S6]QUD89371.1 MFS transporter [Caulobacter sp. S6]